MPQLPRSRTLSALSALIVSFVGRPASAATCESLRALTLPSTPIVSAESLPAGSFTPPAGRAVDGPPAFCPRRRPHPAAPRLGHPVRGVDAGRGLERQAPGRGERRLLRLARLP